MAFRGADPHNLRKLAAKQLGPIIEVDRECRGCGYNLRGLRLGVNCPECGLSSSPSVSKIDDPLSLMPVRVIMAFIRGCWVASLCVGGLLATLIVHQFEIWNDMTAASSVAGLALFWLGAVFWLTPAFSIPQATVRGFTTRNKLRSAARWLQVGWLIAAAALLGHALAANPKPGVESLISLGLWIGVAGGMVGLVILCILLERLAEWTRDDDAERMFSLSMWCLPLATAAYLSGFTQMGGRFGIIILAIWILLSCTFPYGLLTLSKSVTLTILHSLEHKDRTSRKNERDERLANHAASRARRTTQPLLRSEGQPRINTNKRK